LAGPVKNTGDLQGENLQKYNIRPCNREKKGSRHETGKNREKNRRKQFQKQGTALLAATKKPADEQRRATDRTNPRLGFQPSPILRANASKRKKRSRYPRSRLPSGCLGRGRGTLDLSDVAHHHL
jgi:hypothetical protein